MSQKVAIGSPDDWGRWIAILGALVSLGVLPKRWQKAVGVAGAVVVLVKWL